jgi:hypothetical protein
MKKPVAIKHTNHMPGVRQPMHSNPHTSIKKVPLSEMDVRPRPGTEGEAKPQNNTDKKTNQS